MLHLLCEFALPNKELLLRGMADRLVADLIDSRSVLDRLVSETVDELAPCERVVSASCVRMGRAGRIPSPLERGETQSVCL